MCGEERDRAPVDTVPSSLEQGKDAVPQSQDLVQDVTALQNRYSSLCDTPVVVKDRQECERERQREGKRNRWQCDWLMHAAGRFFSLFPFFPSFICSISWFNRCVVIKIRLRTPRCPRSTDSQMLKSKTDIKSKCTAINK